MKVTELGMVKDVKEWHTAKAEYPIEVTEGGSVIELKYQQLLKACSSMFVNPVKYCNSLKVKLVPSSWKAFRNVSPKLVTAAASA